MPINATQRLEAGVITAFHQRTRVRAPKGPDKRLLSSGPDTNHDIFTDLDPDPPSDVSSESGSYSDPDTEPDIGPDSDPEGEFLRKRIDYHESAGRAKPRRSDWTNGLVKREVEHWQKLVPTSYILDLFLLLTVAL